MGTKWTKQQHGKEITYMYMGSVGVKERKGQIRRKRPMFDKSSRKGQGE